MIGENGYMIGTPRPRKYTYMLPLCLFTLLLAIAWPAAAAAQPADLPPGEAGATPGGGTGPSTGPSTGPPTGGGGTPTPTPTPPPSPPPPPPTTPTPTPGGNGNLPPDPTGGNGNTLTLAQTLAEYELIKALAPNRIIFHPATPIQLCKVKDGLQIYYVGRDGKTRLGPWVPSFAELAAKISPWR